MDVTVRSTQVSESQGTPDPGLPETLAFTPPPTPLGARPTDAFGLLTPPAELTRTGSRIAGYEVLGEIARGGMGVVYKALDPSLGRIVAIKVLRFAGLASPEEIQRFHREAQAVAQLSHPRIVPIHEIGQWNGEPFFTMAFVPGGSLTEHQEQYRTDVRLAVELIESVARTMHFAHVKGVFHRDLKPSNILLDDSGEPLVSDFGIAKFANSELDLTVTGAVLGTPAYMAPEQAAGETSNISAATDVWSLGVMLYELATGRRPFKAKDRDQLRDAIRHSDPEHPRSISRSLDRDLETIILKCLEKSPADRYATAEALADDLENWLDGEAISARRHPLPVRAWRRVRRHPAIATAATMLALVGLVAAVASYILDPDRPLKTIERQLAQGKPIVLVPENGVPVWSEMVLGASQGQAGRHPDEPSFTMTSNHISLLELVRDPKQERYRVRADIQHTYEQPQSGRVGVYFGRSLQVLPHGSEHTLCAWCFSDQTALPTSPTYPDKLVSHVRFFVKRVVDSDNRPNAGSATINSQICERFVPARNIRNPKSWPRDPLPWRQLFVEVRPDVITLGWDGHTVGVVSRAEMERYATRLATMKSTGLLPHAPVADFSPHDSLGLFVEYGSAAFRNVVIEPLDE